MAIAWLNGDWLAPEAARVSVFDRGFMFGDGVYEVMAVYGGRVFMLDAHLARLGRSLAAARMAAPMGDEALRDLLRAAVRKSGERLALLYLQVTRGASLPRRHAFPSAAEPTLLVTVMPAPGLAREHIRPYRLASREDCRWARGDIKATSLIANVLMKNEALAEGCDEALLLRDGMVTEAAAANLFIVADGGIATPPASQELLHGITRGHLLALARGAGLAVQERPVSLEEALAASEVWLTSTSLEVWPVSHIDGKPIGEGAPGEVFQQVDALFQESKRALKG